MPQTPACRPVLKPEPWNQSVHANPFSDRELQTRIARVRAEMESRDIDLALLSSPENIFYLIGLDHWGYFAPHVLAVPLEGEMILVTRQMEQVAVRNMVRNARFEGHSDSQTAAEKVVELFRARAPGRSIGIEAWSSGLSFASGERLREGLSPTRWTDISGIVDDLRMVKSPEELRLMQKAASASDAAAQAAIAAIADGTREADVAAECLAAMTRAGGTPPGFGPFIRPEARFGEEHTSWGSGTYHRGERVFLEVAGCCARYNAPQGRLVHLGSIRDEDAEMTAIATRAFEAVIEALKPGRTASEVYAAWQSVVDAEGMTHYRRHHCGYVVGIGFPPSWTGGNRVVGLRHDSNLVIATGMTFHIMSWLAGTGRGDAFISNTVMLGPQGAEILTRTPMTPLVR